VAWHPASEFHASIEIASTWVWSVQTLITWSYKVPKPNKYLHAAQRSIVRACRSPLRRKRVRSCEDLVVEPTSFSPTACTSDQISYRQRSDMKECILSFQTRVQVHRLVTYGVCTIFSCTSVDQLKHFFPNRLHTRPNGVTRTQRSERAYSKLSNAPSHATFGSVLTMLEVREDFRCCTHATAMVSKCCSVAVTTPNTVVGVAS
jgi:hypothetical protein